MIAFLYELIKKLKKEKKSYWSLGYKIGKLFVNVFYPISAMLTKQYGLDENSRIIVSLTTYPARVNTVWMTVASLLNQTMKPHKVILWLSEEQFRGVELPKKLTKLQKRGLDIRFCEDLKPHKKYYYTMTEYKGYTVVTADDDILYPENHLEKLWQGHEKYPDTVICNWSHEIAFGDDGDFLPYNNWEDNGEAIPSHLTLAVGCNGVLYPPESLDKEVFHKGKIYESALYTDDLWLKCMEIKKGTKVVNCNETPLIYFNIVSAQKTGLWKKNTGMEERNDKVWEVLMAQYPEVKNTLLEAQKEKEV